MIVRGEITEAQRLASRKNYYFFSALNGLSYICVGETIIILFAVRLNFPDAAVSAIGALLYIGYLLLPTGKLVAARVGAAQCQAVFWVSRNIAGLLVASASLAIWLGYGTLSMVLVLLGGFLFYGFRAAGLAMSQPLLSEWTTVNDRSKVIADSNGLFYLSNIVALILITVILKFFPGIWTLTCIIAAGSVLGIGASRCVNNICETEALRNSARTPLFRQFAHLFHERLYRKILLNTFICNLTVILLVPISMLALKRGYHVSDADALIYAVCQFGASSVFSFLGPWIFKRYSTKWVLVISYGLMLFLTITWLAASMTFHPWFGACLFILCGSSYIIMMNAMTHYFIATVRKPDQVAFSILVSVISGAGAGVAGLLLAGMFLRGLGAALGALSDTILFYKVYFGCCGILLVPGILFPAQLPDHPSGGKRDMSGK